MEVLFPPEGVRERLLARRAASCSDRGAVT